MLTVAAKPELAPFSSLDFSGGVVIAVSGGSDSTALLLLLKAYLDQRHPAAPLLAVTVDHALRPGSAAEAKAVARLCAAHGIAHRIVAWSGPKPATGVPAAAREARYRLLAQAAREAGVDVIVTGHTADDQAETVRMRQARTTGDDAPGLAGMARATLYDGAVWIARPLLGTRREALRDFLRAKDIGWIDDPTNADPRLERPRLRQGADDGRRVVEGLAISRRTAQERAELGSRAADILRAFAGQPVPGLVRLSQAFAHADDHAALVHALRVLLAVVGGATFLPAKDRTEVLIAKLRAGKARATLSRCVADVRRPGIFLHRERRDLPSPEKAANGMIWDGRRRITFGDEADGLVIAPRGVAAAEMPAIEPGCAPQSLMTAANAAEPAFWRGPERLRAIEAGGKIRCEPVMAPWLLFLPSFDLTLARAVSNLVGAPPVPEPPFSGPNDVKPWSNA